MFGDVYRESWKIKCIILIVIIIIVEYYIIYCFICSIIVNSRIMFVVTHVLFICFFIYHISYNREHFITLLKAEYKQKKPFFNKTNDSRFFPFSEKQIPIFHKYSFSSSISPKNEKVETRRDSPVSRSL